MAQEIIIGEEVNFFYGYANGAKTVKEGRIVGTNGELVKIEGSNGEIITVHRTSIIDDE